MSEQPLFEKEQQNLTERFWKYSHNELSLDEAKAFETSLENSTELQKLFFEFKETMQCLQSWHSVQAPKWNIHRMFPKKAVSGWQFPLTLVLASLALVISLLPYFHITEQGLYVRFSQDYVSSKQLDEKLNHLTEQQLQKFENKLTQLKIAQNSNNKVLVVTLLKYAEQKRRNDLLQMASWFSKQSELNNQQQRQIVNWVANEQQQNEAQITALWNSLDANE